jgi:hypothetical protein
MKHFTRAPPQAIESNKWKTEIALKTRLGKKMENRNRAQDPPQKSR